MAEKASRDALAEARALEAARVNLYLHAENVRVFNTQQRPRLPVVIVTGFLGSGKTTLLRHLLTNKQNLRLAAAVNDFAALNIDESLIRSLPAKAQANRVMELSNGCICCSLMGSLQEAVWSLLQEGGDVDLDNINYLVIETSGITDPTRIVTSLEAKFGKMYRARLDAVVTVVDVDLFSQWLPCATTTKIGESEDAGGSVSAQKGSTNTYDIPNEVAVHQLRAADVIILNKMDLVSEATADAVKEMVLRHAAHARIVPAIHAKVALDAVLDVQSSDDHSGIDKIGFHTHEKVQTTYTPSLAGGALLRRPQSRPSANGSRSSHDAHAHTPGDAFHSLAIDIDHARGPISMEALLRFIAGPAVKGLVRAKGILWLTCSSPGFQTDSHTLPKNSNPDSLGRGHRPGTVKDSTSKDHLRNWRCVIHMSGRAPGRWSWELDGQWSGPPHSEIVFIGSRQVLDLEFLRKACDELPLSSTAAVAARTTGSEEAIAEANDKRDQVHLSSARCSPEKRIGGDKEKSLRQLIADTRFDLLHPQNSISTSRGTILWFRLTGARRFGFSLEDLTLRYRIDLDQVSWMCMLATSTLDVHERLNGGAD